MSLELRPTSIKAARRFVGAHHRHNLPPNGGLFAVAVFNNDECVGVAIAARPVARLLADDWTVEITRCCTDGTPNASSMLYGSLTRAAKALGYRRIITYTLQSEPGTSLKAAGFRLDAEVKLQSWDRPNRRRIDVDLFGNATKPTEGKNRWVKESA